MNIHVNKLVETAIKTAVSFGRAFIFYGPASLLSEALNKFWMAFDYRQMARSSHPVYRPAGSESRAGEWTVDTGHPYHPSC